MQRSLLRVLMTMTGLLARDGRIQDAEPEVRAIQAIAEGWAVREGATAEDRTLAVWAHRELGGIKERLEKPKEAEAEYRAALAILKTFAGQPTTALFQNEYAGTMVNLARMLTQQKQPEEARRWLEKAEPHHKAALASEPRNAGYRLLFRNNRSTLADCLVDLGDHAAAAQAAEEWLAYAADAKTDNYHAASCLARCVSLVQKDEKLTAAVRQERATRYSERAVKLLRQAVAGGWQDAEELKKNAALDSLRDRPDFQKVLADLDAGNRK
jgi:tetratricopeptide (TPR) repeat protein